MPRSRKALNHLKDWAEQPNRKPLIIRGARQVGKSTLVRMLGQSFSTFIELNVERPEIQDLFTRFSSVDQLFQAILLKYNITQTGDRLLLFIDEIQESPAAIRMLRYFYEEKPEIHVIAAGSLLDFALSEVKSFPVGRVSYYYLFPLDFEEFLQWTDHKEAIKVLQEIPFPDYAYDTLFQLFHQYALIGGMPEIVAHYAENKQIAQLSPLYNSLWQAFVDDIEKYGETTKQRQVLRHVIRTAPLEQDRIKFAGFGQSNYQSREVGEALRTLNLARVLDLIYPITQTQLPLASDYKKRPRLQILDTGLLNHILGIQQEIIGIEDLHQLYRGRIIHHLLTQELYNLYPYENFSPHFWVRENSNANSEVDLIYVHRQHIIPVEVKSGPEGRLKSLHQFIQRAPHPYAVRFLKNKVSIESYTTPEGKPYFLMNLPYFLMGKIETYVNYLKSEHPQ